MRVREGVQVLVLMSGVQRGVQGSEGSKWGAGVGLSPPKISVWAQMFPLHARCSAKWPQENYFAQKFQNFVSEFEILYGNLVWPLFAEQKCLVSFCY
jgi:hypothetical protein